MKKLLRWLGFHVHEWGPWETYDAWMQRIQGGVEIGDPYCAKRQKRCCNTCGIMQRRDFAMTPPLPPPGYELVEDEPREGDMALVGTRWLRVDADRMITFWMTYLPARNLRWIARKI